MASGVRDEPAQGASRRTVAGSAAVAMLRKKFDVLDKELTAANAAVAAQPDNPNVFHHRAELYLARLPEGQRAPGRKAEEERLRSWLTNKYVRLKWADPEWAASLTASRERASKVAASKVAAPGARGRKSALKGAVGKAGGARPRKMGKMPSLSSDG